MAMKPEEKKAKQKAYYQHKRDEILKKRKEYRKRPGVVERQKEYLLRHYAKKLAEMEQEGSGN